MIVQIRVGMIVIAILCLTQFNVAAEPQDLQLRMGMVQGMFRDVKPTIVQALSRPFRQLMLNQTNCTGEVEICDDALCMTEKLKAGKLEMGVYHGFEFAWAQQHCETLLPLMITQPYGDKVQAVIIVHKDCKLKSIRDFKNQSVLIPNSAKAHSLVYFDKLRNGLNDDCAKPNWKTELSVEEALNAVVLGEEDAALIDLAALEGYQILQPGAYRNLRVLEKSEAFPPAVIAYREGALSAEQVRRLRDGLAKAQKTASGKMMMTFWNLQGFTEPPKDFQTQLDTILKAYPVPKADQKSNILPSKSPNQDN